jgi:hypothetical protein
MSESNQAELAPVPTERIPFWRSVGQALRGEHHDYTAEPLPRAVLLLAVPMVLEMVMESIFAIVDVFWVAKLGASAVATVALTESMMAIVYTLAFGLAIGTTATVARRVGEKDPDGAANAAVQAIVLGLIVSISLGALGAVFAPDLLRLMGAGPDVLSIGSGFARVMLGGSASVFMLFVINAALRGAGDAAVAMRVLWFANALNIILGPLFIFGVGPFPEMGVTGAAVATHRRAPPAPVAARPGNGQPDTTLRRGNAADPAQHHGVDWTHPDPCDLRQRGRRRLRHRNAHHHFRAASRVRPQQRCRDHGRPVTRFGPAGSSRVVGVDRVAL